VKNPDAPAVKRETEEDWGGAGHRHSKPRQTDAEEQKIALADEGLASPEIAADIGVDGRALPSRQRSRDSMQRF
jgi:hypothetical protein